MTVDPTNQSDLRPYEPVVVASSLPADSLINERQVVDHARPDAGGHSSSHGSEITEGRRDAQRALVSILDQAIFAITTFGTSVVVGRLLLESQFSIYYLAMTMIIVMRNVQSELVTAPYSVFRQRFQGDERRAYAGSIIQHQLVVALAGIAPIAMMLIAAHVGWVSSGMIPTLYVLLGVTPFLLIRSFLRAFSFASYRFWPVVWIDATVGAVQFLGIVGLWYTGCLTVAGTYAVMGFACGMGILVWLWTKPEPVIFDRSRRWSDWKSNWEFSRWALASQLTGTTAPYLVPWLLEAVHGDAATGIYGACFTVVGLSLHFVTALANYLTPRAASAYTQEGGSGLLRLLKKAAVVYLAVLGSIFLSFAVLGDWPVRFIYGDAFAGGNWTCLLLAGFAMAISMSVICGNGLWAVNRPEANLWADIATMIVTLASAIWLIPDLGKDGAAAAMLIGASFGTAIRWAALKKVLSEGGAAPSDRAEGVAR